MVMRSGVTGTMDAMIGARDVARAAALVGCGRHDAEALSDGLRRWGFESSALGDGSVWVYWYHSDEDVGSLLSYRLDLLAPCMGDGSRLLLVRGGGSCSAVSFDGGEVAVREADPLGELF